MSESAKRSPERKLEVVLAVLGGAVLGRRCGETGRGLSRVRISETGHGLVLT